MWRAVRSWLFPVWCLGCGAPASGVCGACLAGATAERAAFGELVVASAGAYEGHLRDAVLALKRGERALLDPLAALIAPLLPPGVAVVPVVTTRRRAAERGFDQARELARRASAGGAICDALRKTGPAQRGRSRADRVAAAGRFRLRRGAALPCEVVLLDDVVTTGATLRDAAALLRAGGVAVRGAIVVARAPLRETSPRARRSDGT